MNKMYGTAFGLLVLSAVFGGACGSSGGPSGFNQDGGSDGSSPMLTDTGLHLTGDAPSLSDGSGGSGDGGGGFDAGPPVCDVSCTAAGGTCSPAGVCTLSENPGGVSSGTQGQLRGGGSADTLFGWLYPYDQTVFPRGLISPTLQLDGTTGADSVWVHIEFPAMTYDGFFAGSSPLRVQLPDLSWKAITYAARPTDAVKVSVTKISGGMVTGPSTETWTIASGNIRGTIYYETYGSTILGGPASVGIMQINPGATAPTPVKKGCGNVCHTASADGSTLVANVALGFSSASYDLKTSASTIFKAAGEKFTYGGIYPDGSFVISATGYRTWTGTASKLYSTSTGTEITTTNWSSLGVTTAGTVAFAPDGKLVAFNKNGSTISVANFDLSGYAFSGLSDLVTGPPTSGLSTLAWPAFTPDDKTIAFHAGSNAAFETDGGASGDIYIVDVASKMMVRADALDGYTSSGGTYLPAKDTALNFAPTILPEAVGGYFWVVFTSHRSYGNLLPSMDNGDQNGKLWVAALDLNAPPGTDGTHPAFYLDGQEAPADNLRGFWVLPPCKNTGTTCSSGDECCTGYCRPVSGGGDACVSPPMGCAHEYEKCTASSDCCDKSDQCIGGFCSQPAPK